MSRTPPIPAAAQSPFPLQEPPHTAQPDTVTDQAAASFDQGIASARDAAGPLVDKARTFVRERPWTAAALIGTIGLAVINTLRGKRP